MSMKAPPRDHTSTPSKPCSAAWVRTRSCLARNSPGSIAFHGSQAVSPMVMAADSQSALPASRDAGRSGLAVVVVDAALTPHEQAISLVATDRAALVAVGIARDRRPVDGREHEHADARVGAVGDLVRALRAIREAHGVAGLEL